MKITLITDADPTRTMSLRMRFAQDLAARFMAIRKDIKPTIQAMFKTLFKDDALGEGKFVFKTNAEKVEEFMAWLNQREKEEGLLLSKKSTGASAVTNPVWADIYIESAYKAGLRRAQSELNKVKIPTASIEQSLSSPVHAERVGMIYTRVYSDLTGITEEMDKQISRVLADALIQGDNAEIAAKNIVDRIDKIGITRARTLARTEIVRAHHAGNITEYKNYNIKGVKVLAELLVSGNNTCPECYAEQEKGARPIGEVENLIPLHPNCACVVLPSIE